MKTVVSYKKWPSLEANTEKSEHYHTRADDRESELE